MPRMAACGCGLRTKAACSMSAALISSIKRPLPVRSGRSSSRGMRAPISDGMIGPLLRHCLRRFIDHLLWGRIKLGDELLNAAGAEWIDIHALLFRLGEEFRIAHG